MAIRVVHERLSGSIGPGFGWGDDRNPPLYCFLIGLFRIVDLKSKVVGPCVLLRASVTCPARLIVFENQVNLLISDLKPMPFECKCGPGNVIHAEKIDIEFP